MPVEGEWFAYTGANITSDALARARGVYEIANSEKLTVFIGSGDIRRKLQQHADPNQRPKYIPEMDRTWFRLERTPFPCSREVQLLDEYNQDHGHPPKYNANAVRYTEIFSRISKLS